MTYIINWDNCKVVCIEKIDKKYISILDRNGYLHAIQSGMPGFLLSGIKVLSYELPKLVQNRIRGYETLSETEIVSYIKKTKCRCNTDKFSIIVSD